MNDTKYREYGLHDLNQLAEALIADNPAQFARYIVWQRSMLKGHNVPDYFVELQLQTEQTVLGKMLPPDYRPVVAVSCKVPETLSLKQTSLLPHRCRSTVPFRSWQRNTQGYC